MKNNMLNKTKKTILDASPAKAVWQYLASVMCIAMVSTGACAAPEKPGHWHNASPLPYRVQEIYPTVFNEHIVVAGGLSPDVDENRIGVSDRVLVYSVKDNTWTDGPRLPEPRHHPMLVVVGDRLLSFGGFTVDNKGAWHNSVDVLELVLDPKLVREDILQQGQWKKIAELPAPLAETLSAVNDGKVHLVTGRTPIDAAKNSQWNDQSDVNTHYLFDLKDLSWSKGLAVPTARNSACSVKTKDKLHTIGGRTVSGGNLPSHEVYDFEKKLWKTLAPLPQAQGGLACALNGDRIYVFGGEFFDNGGGVYSEVWEYNIRTDNWRAVSHMPNPRHGLGALNIDGKLYVIAGASQAGGNQTSNTMSVFSPKNLNDN